MYNIFGSSVFATRALLEYLGAMRVYKQDLCEHAIHRDYPIEHSCWLSIVE